MGSVDLRNRCYPLQKMPKRSSLNLEERKAAETLFLENHLDPKAWTEAEDSFVEAMKDRFRYSFEGDAWKRKKWDLHTTYTSLHRKAAGEGWIVEVAGRWRLTDKALARYYGGPFKEAAPTAPDAHDSRLRQFFRELLGALQPKAFVPSPDPWKGSEPVEVDERIERDPLFRDVAFHAGLMKLPDRNSPISSYRVAKGLARRRIATRQRVRAKCAQLLEAKGRLWSGENTRTFIGALAALDLVLTELADGKAEIPRPTPHVERREIRVSGYTIFEGDVNAHLSEVLKAWDDLVARSRRKVLRTYRTLRRQRASLDEAKERCRVAVGELLAHSHYPGHCKYRGMLSRSASD